jgi:hypothetical protein
MPIRRPNRAHEQHQQQHVLRISDRGFNFQHSKNLQHSKHFTAQPSVFSRLKFPNSVPLFSPHSKGILSPPPNNGHRLNGGNLKSWASSQGRSCLNCGRTSHREGKCWFPPQNLRSVNSSPLHHAPSTSTAAQLREPPRFSSFSDYYSRGLRLPPSPLVIVPWSRTWRLKAPDFLDESPPPSPLPVTTLVSQPPRFSSFSEFASSVLGISPIPPPLHLAWIQKTTLATVLLLSPLRHLWCFVLWILIHSCPMVLSDL